jgi:cytochrome P450
MVNHAVKIEDAIDHASSISAASITSHSSRHPTMFFLTVWSWVVAAVLYAVYRFYLFPTLLSPLRHIPKAHADWRFRLYEWVYTEPDPIRISRWMAKTPHRGLVRYPGIGGTERVVPLTSDAVKEVLVTKAYSCFERPTLSRARFRALLGNGLLSVDDSEHKLHRRKLAPAFAFRHIQGLYPVFWSKACELVNGLETAIVNSPRQPSIPSGHAKGLAHEPKTQDIELRQWTSRAALDVIGAAAWGNDFGALVDPRSDLIRMYSYIQKGSPRANRQGKLLYAAALLVPMKTLALIFPCEFFDKLEQGKRALRGACAKALSLKRNVSRDDEQAPRHDILDVAVESEAFSDEALIDHMLTILVAGHETSSLAATWACYLLCKHPDIQTRLRAEIRSKLPSPSGASDGTQPEVSADVLEHMPLLRAVARESLRVIPAVPLVRREAMRDTTILDYHIPAATSVIPMAWILHKSRIEWGPDATDFKPERWLQPGQEATGGAKSKFSDLSFSTGPRSYIGEGFAKGENLALLAAIVGRFELELAPEHDLDLEKMNLIWGITVKPAALKFRLRIVEGW